MSLLQVNQLARDKTSVLGLRAIASLIEDQAQGIVANLRENLHARLNEITNRIDDTMLLIQIYPDGEWDETQPFTHIVGVAVETLEHIPAGMVGHTIPAGSYLRFIHEGDEAEIDDVYPAIQDWLASHHPDNERAFDFECWHDPLQIDQAQTRIDIYIPL